MLECFRKAVLILSGLAIRGKVGILALLLIFSFGCGSYFKGPDKQGQGVVSGATAGAISGAITGFQLGATTGSGALVGAGVGALAGSAKGILVDGMEERIYRLKLETDKVRRSALAQSILIELMHKQVAMHPSRELYPADLFFVEGSAKLSDTGEILLEELGKLVYNRLPWSRIGVASYITSSDLSKDNKEQLIIAEDRAKAIGNALVSAGVEPRRVIVWGQLLNKSIFIDPDDDPFRYNQSIEIIAIDNVGRFREGVNIGNNGKTRERRYKDGEVLSIK